MQHAHRSAARRGFTLVEMLVVITIIGILVALLIPTVGGVMKRTRNAAMAVELQDLSRALEAYKSFANDYPPDFTNAAAITAHISKAFPRNTRPINGTNGWWTNTPANWTVPNQTNNLDRGEPPNLDPAEALVFWLSLLSTNPRDPLSGAHIAYAGERKVLFTFDQTRLVDLDGDLWPEYVPKYGKGAPYVYFDGRVVGGKYAYDTAVYPKAALPPQPATVQVVRPYRSNTVVNTTRDNGRTQPYNNPTNYNLNEWLKPGAFQIICAGQDSEFGIEYVVSNAVVFKEFPRPNFTIAGAPDEDNLADFSEMKTFGEAAP